MHRTGGVETESNPAQIEDSALIQEWSPIQVNRKAGGETVTCGHPHPSW